MGLVPYKKKKKKEKKMKRKRLKSYLFWSHEGIYNQKVTICKPGRGVSQGTKFASTLILDFQVQNCYCLHSIYAVFVIAAGLAKTISLRSTLCNFCYNISSTLVQHLIRFPYLFYVLSTPNNYFDGNPSDKFHYSRNFHLFFNPQKNHTMLFPFYCPKTCSS